MYYGQLIFVCILGKGDPCNNSCNSIALSGSTASNSPSVKPGSSDVCVSTTSTTNSVSLSPSLVSICKTDCRNVDGTVQFDCFSLGGLGVGILTALSILISSAGDE